MGGVNDDPEVPVFGGWTRLVLDLSPYLGHPSVQVRFRFQSDDTIVQPGAYIDDFHVYGRTRVPHGPREGDPIDAAPIDQGDVRSLTANPTQPGCGGGASGRSGRVSSTSSMRTRPRFDPKSAPNSKRRTPRRGGSR